MAAAYDGHPENAAASVFGGLVAATMVEGRPVHAPLPLSDELAFVVIVPERNLATPEARGVLPDSLTPGRRGVQPGPHGPAAGRPGRPGALVAGRDRRPHPPAGPHRPVPRGARRSCAALVDAGALAASWSGAGPTLIGMVRAGSVAAVRAGAEAALARVGRARPASLALRADRRGIVYGDEAEVPL